MTEVQQLDPFSDAVLADPLEFQQQIRDAGPVVHLENYDVYGIARYDVVHAALIDWQHLSSARGVGLRDRRNADREPGLLLEADPPHHDAPRHVIEPILSPQALRRLRETWVAHAEDVVDNLLAGGDVDAVRDLAEAFPLKVFPDAVGVTSENREALLPYADHIFNSFGPLNSLADRGTEGFRERVQFVDSLCERESLAPGGFGAEIWQAADRGDVTHAQAPLLVRALLTAGIDTTVHGLSALLSAIITHPRQWEQLRAERGRIRTAFDEAVRWESPVQTFFRVATQDLDIGGQVVPSGARVLMFLGAANRDPRRWDRPDEFDVLRDPSGHVGFGMGLHQCIGQHVARLEAECLISVLAEKVKVFEPSGEPVRHLNNTLRGWESLPVRLVAA
jgi:cytochrome P450